jgi:hypothetical protein
VHQIEHRLDLSIVEGSICPAERLLVVHGINLARHRPAAMSRAGKGSPCDPFPTSLAVYGVVKKLTLMVWLPLSSSARTSSSYSVPGSRNSLGTLNEFRSGPMCTS